ncbi:hypothetical protein BKA62DRAFT_771703 [Auriculariales sp. MPI-PUGE-AT-0066]|nr:hypothetical protein BKA62DRAFT_771703 [Auriculariales sp. MPI-PUGE-AT-0066]
MSVRERKVASMSLTRSMGKAFSGVLNGKPPGPPMGLTKSAVLPAELGGPVAGAKTSMSLKRSSLQSTTRSAIPTFGQPGFGVSTLSASGLPSGRTSSRASSTTTTTTESTKLPSVAEDVEATKPKATSAPAAKPKPKLPRPTSTTLQPTALPKFKPKSSLAATSSTTPPPEPPASPTRLTTRKRKPSNGSSSPPNTGREKAATPPSTATIPQEDRPVSPLPKRMLQKAAPPAIKTTTSSVVPAPKEPHRFPAKKIARHNSPATSPLRSSPTQSTPVKSLAKKKAPGKTGPLATSTPPPARLASKGSASPNSSMEVSLMLEGVVSSSPEPTPNLPRIRPTSTRTPSSTMARNSRFSVFDARGSILSWEDMSRSFGHNIEELGTFLTKVDAPFTPGDRTLSVYSDGGGSSTWGSPQASNTGLTPGMSIGQIMFPTQPGTINMADSSFSGESHSKTMSPLKLNISTTGEHIMDVDGADDVPESDEEDNPFAPRSPDEKQAAVLVLQMQLAALNNIREERDALRSQLQQMTDQERSGVDERDGLRTELDAMQTARNDAELSRRMFEVIAQEERLARVAAEDAARAVSQRDADLRARLKSEAMRLAAAEWSATATALRAEVERLQADRGVLGVMGQTAATVAAC